jgi:hypothetical protein
LTVLALVCFVVADGATCGSTEDAMMTGEMPRSAAHQCAFNASFCLGWSRYGDKRERNCGASKNFVHVSYSRLWNIEVVIKQRGSRKVPANAAFERCGRRWLARFYCIGRRSGRTAGGLIGALTAAGVSKEDAHVYAEGIRRGGTLVTTRVPDADRANCEAILNRASGWKEFDATATRYTADQVRQERELYRW